MFFVLCFIKTQPFVKRKPVKTEKKIPERSLSVLGRFYCILKTVVSDGVDI